MSDDEFFVEVRSQDRISGTPSHYVVNLPSLIPNVIQVEFVASEFPNTIFSTVISYVYFTISYTLSSQSNTVDIVVPIQPGIYETTDLMNLMTNSMYLVDTYLTTNVKLDPTIVNFKYNEHLAIFYMVQGTDRKSTRLNSSHITRSRMPSSA